MVAWATEVPRRRAAKAMIVRIGGVQTPRGATMRRDGGKPQMKRAKC